MHPLIKHFLGIAPTWLLIDWEWAATQRSGPYLLHCSDIVSVKRVRWFEGTEHTEKRSHAWYKFDSRHSSGPVLHRWRDEREEIPSLCEQCRKRYQPQRSSSRFCSDTCRQRAHRRRVGVTLSVTPSRAETPPEKAQP
jgi:hypothetical protein